MRRVQVHVQRRQQAAFEPNRVVGDQPVFVARRECLSRDFSALRADIAGGLAAVSQKLAKRSP
mgnify:CR=1 FL=1